MIRSAMKQRKSLIVQGITLTQSPTYPQTIYVAMDAPAMAVLGLEVEVMKRTNNRPHVNLLHDPEEQTFLLGIVPKGQGPRLHLSGNVGRLTLCNLDPEIIPGLLGPANGSLSGRRTIADFTTREWEGRRFLAFAYAPEPAPQPVRQNQSELSTQSEPQPGPRNRNPDHVSPFAKLGPGEAMPATHAVS
jgi:hypothetical protein